MEWRRRFGDTQIPAYGDREMDTFRHGQVLEASIPTLAELRADHLPTGCRSIGADPSRRLALQIVRHTADLRRTASLHPSIPSARC